jgi:hypothetical protein
MWKCITGLFTRNARRPVADHFRNARALPKPGEASYSFVYDVPLEDRSRNPPRKTNPPKISPFRGECEKLNLSAEVWETSGHIYVVGNELWFQVAKPFYYVPFCIDLATYQVTRSHLGDKTILPEGGRILCTSPSGMVIVCNASATLVSICDGNQLANGILKPLMSQETTGDYLNNNADRAMYLGINEYGQEEVVFRPGNNSSGIPCAVYLLNLTTFVWKIIQVAKTSPILPPSLSWCDCCVATPDRLLLFDSFVESGNYLDEDSKYFDNIWEFNVRTGVWRLLETDTPGPCARSNIVSIVQGSWMIIVGGYSAIYGELDDCWAFNLIQHEWHQILVEGDKCPPLWGHCWTKLPDGRCVLIGGRWGENSGPAGANLGAYAFRFYNVVNHKNTNTRLAVVE